MRIAGSAREPNNWSLQGVPDDEEPTRWMRAMVSVCRSRPWFGGYGLWAWPLRLLSRDHYHFCQKPALAVIRQEFGGERYDPN